MPIGEDSGTRPTGKIEKRVIGYVLASALPCSTRITVILRTIGCPSVPIFSAPGIVTAR